MADPPSREHDDPGRCESRWHDDDGSPRPPATHEVLAASCCEGTRATRLCPACLSWLEHLMRAGAYGRCRICDERIWWSQAVLVIRRL